MTAKSSARVVGILYITAVVAGLLSLLVLEPVVDADDVLTEAATSENRRATVEGWSMCRPSSRRVTGRRPRC